MASTFLTLTNKLLRRFNELELTSTTFSGAKGVHSLAKDSIIDSLNTINQQDWMWPFNYVTTGTADFTMTIGTELYSAPATAEAVDLDNVYINKTTTPSQQAKKLTKITHEEYKRNLEVAAANQTASTDYGIPLYVCQRPDLKLVFHPKPDQAYSIHVPFWAIPTEPSLHSDTVTVPTRFDNVIVDGGIWYLAMMRNDTERALQERQKKFEDGVHRMKRLLINPNLDTFKSTTIHRSTGMSLKYIETQ